MMAETLYDGPTVRPSLWLHFHYCPTCAHTWSCVSSTCLAMRGHIRPGQTEPDDPMPALRIEERCRKHQA